MKVSLSTLKLLLGMFILLLVSACSDDSSSSSSKKDLKKVNIYFTDNEIHTFNPYTGISRKLSDYNTGQNTLQTLNTDNNKKGFELIVYALDNSIYLIDPNSKELSPVKLDTLDTEICIFPHANPDESSFTGSTKGEAILVDEAKVFVTPKTATGCDQDAPTVISIDFSEKSRGKYKIVVSEVNAARLWGETLLDYDYNPRKFSDAYNINKGPGRFGFLGSRYNTNKNSLALNFYDHEGNSFWETSFESPSALPTIDQITPSKALIQVGGDIHLLNIIGTDNLFDVTTIESDETTTGSRLEALFKFPANLSTPDITDLQIASNGRAFALVYDGAVWFYDDEENQFRSLTTKDDSVAAIKIAMTDDGTLLLHRTLIDNEGESLVSINTTSSTPETIIEESPGSKISFITLDNNIYINSFSLSGWQASWINTSFSRKDYDRSIFIFTKDSRSANADIDIFLIASDEVNTLDGYLSKPQLYKFDPKNRTNGRERYKDKKKIYRDFVFGLFLVDVKEVTQSEIFNDVYGKLELKVIRDVSGIDADGTDTYFFNPSEEDTYEAKKNDNALQLIRFEEDII